MKKQAKNHDKKNDSSQFGLDCSAQGECIESNNTTPDEVLTEFLQKSDENKDVIAQLEKIDEISSTN